MEKRRLELADQLVRDEIEDLKNVITDEARYFLCILSMALVLSTHLHSLQALLENNLSESLSTGISAEGCPECPGQPDRLRILDRFGGQHLSRPLHQGHQSPRGAEKTNSNTHEARPAHTRTAK